MSIRVLVVDDHDMVRRGIVSYLETEQDIEVVGEAADGRQAVEAATRHRPDIILMDLIMEPVDGIEATRQIKSVLPDARIIVLTSFVDEEQIFPALEAGALSYLLKTSRADEILAAIRSALKGDSVIAPRVASKMLRRLQPQTCAPHAALTPRELEVLALIGEGKTNQEISDILFIGIKTTKSHVSSILGKLGVEDRTQAAVYAHRNGLV